MKKLFKLIRNWRIAVVLTPDEVKFYEVEKIVEVIKPVIEYVDREVIKELPQETIYVYKDIIVEVPIQPDDKRYRLMRFRDYQTEQPEVGMMIFHFFPSEGIEMWYRHEKMMVADPELPLTEYMNQPSLWMPLEELLYVIKAERKDQP